MKSTLTRLIPRRLRSIIRRMFYGPGEMLVKWRGKQPDLTPPRHLMSVGPGDFHNIGRHMVRLFTSLGKLQSTDHVLDIGCGVGRMAIPLIKVLESDGNYEGFDIVREAVKWCQRNITSARPNFQFTHIDLYNKSYNDRGKLTAQAHQFDFEDETFDFIFATSVYTHMLPHGLHQYLAESARVLKKGGRCFFTFFIVHPHSKKIINEGKSSLAFKPATGPYWVVDPQEPEKAIAYEQAFIKQLFSECGFEIDSKIHYGSWAKNPKALSFQDVVIAVKK